jgi:hypothetical protein
MATEGGAMRIEVSTITFEEWQQRWLARFGVREADDALQLVPYEEKPGVYVVCAYGSLTRVSASYATLKDNTGRAIFEEHYHDAQGRCLASATRRLLPAPEAR